MTLRHWTLSLLVGFYCPLSYLISWQGSIWTSRHVPGVPRDRISQDKESTLVRSGTWTSICCRGPGGGNEMDCDQDLHERSPWSRPRPPGFRSIACASAHSPMEGGLWSREDKRKGIVKDPSFISYRFKIMMNIFYFVLRKYLRTILYFQFTRIYFLTASHRDCACTYLCVCASKLLSSTNFGYTIYAYQLGITV